MCRAWFLALPVLAVLVVAYSLLVAGAPRAVTAARVYGGPTEGVSRLALRVECVTRDGERESPAFPGPITVHAQASTRIAVETTVVRAVDGVAEADLVWTAPLHGPVSLDVRAASGLALAHGDVSLTSDQWAARARHRGGWIRGRALGELILSIAPARGVFVVGSADSLLLRVERDGKAVPGAKLTVHGEGAAIGDELSLVTDANGRAHIDYSPTDLNPTVHVEATSDDGAHGAIESGVPVVPGGFHVLRAGKHLRVEIAAPRRQAFYAFVTERERIAGGVLALEPDDRGGSITTLPLPRLPQPAWIVVSSEVDLNTTAAIGWPIDASTEPEHTFDVAESLLLDGLPAAFAREQARRSRVRWLTTGFVALALALSAVMLVLRVRAAERDIAQHLRESLDADSVPAVAPRRSWSLLAAVLMVALGFILLALIAAARAS